MLRKHNFWFLQETGSIRIDAVCKKKYFQCMGFRFLLVPFFAMLLLCCAGSEPATVKKEKVPQPPKSRPDSVLVVASFGNLLHLITNYSGVQSSDKDEFIREAVTASCSGGDFIEYSMEGSGFGTTEYSVRLERVPRDSAWFVRRTIGYWRDYSSMKGGNYATRWKKVVVDSVADTAMFLTMMDKMETFTPETTKVEKSNYILVDSNMEGLIYKKGGRCRSARVAGGYFFDSPGMLALFNEMEKWTRDDYFTLGFLPDSNLVRSNVKLPEPVECQVLFSPEPGRYEYVKGFDKPIKLMPGEQRTMFDFSKLVKGSEMLCGEDAGMVRNVWQLDEFVKE